MGYGGEVKESKIWERLCSPTYVFGDRFRRRGLIARFYVRETKTVQISGALQSVLNVRANVFGADVALEFGLVHELRGLFTCAA
jgi:hypothetical protein